MKHPEERGRVSPPDYREFPAGAALAAAVECFWTSTTHTAAPLVASHRVLPDGCMDLIFNFSDSRSLRVSVIGTMTRPLTVTTTGAVDMLGVRFRPGGLPLFLALDAAELTDTSANLTNFWGQAADSTWHRLGEATQADRVRLLQDMLIARVNGNLDPFVRHCVERMEKEGGELRINNLERSTGLGGRQIERKFARLVGISPKTFARVVRFKRVISAMTDATSPRLAALAADLGFADQPHLSREFKTFSGLTPANYLASSRQPRTNVGNLQDPMAPTVLE